MFYVLFLLFAYILNVIDYFFTVYWVDNYGLDIESNPLGRWIFENDLAGFVKIVLVGALFLILALLSKKSRKAIKAGHLLFVVYSVVVLYHTFLVLYIS